MTQSNGPSGPIRLRLVLAATGCLLGFGILLAIAVRTGVGQRMDAWAYGVILNGLPSDVRLTLDVFARRALILVLSPLAALLVLVAVVRGRHRGALVAVTLPLLLLPTALWLRDAAVQRPDRAVGGYDFNTFPSVHATAAFALLAGVVAVWPVAFRPWHVWLLVSTAFAAGLGNVTWYAHRPADVLGSLLLVASLALCCWAVFQPRSGVVGDRPRAATAPR